MTVYDVTGVTASGTFPEAVSFLGIFMNLGLLGISPIGRRKEW